jgi:hypothetical protein
LGSTSTRRTLPLTVSEISLSTAPVTDSLPPPQPARPPRNRLALEATAPVAITPLMKARRDALLRVNAKASVPSLDSAISPG